MWVARTALLLVGTYFYDCFTCLTTHVSQLIKVSQTSIRKLGTLPRTKNLRPRKSQTSYLNSSSENSFRAHLLAISLRLVGDHAEKLPLAQAGHVALRACWVVALWGFVDLADVTHLAVAEKVVPGPP